MPAYLNSLNNIILRANLPADKDPHKYGKQEKAEKKVMRKIYMFSGKPKDTVWDFSLNDQWFYTYKGSDMKLYYLLFAAVCLWFVIFLMILETVDTYYFWWGEAEEKV